MKHQTNMPTAMKSATTWRDTSEFIRARAPARIFHPPSLALGLRHQGRNDMPTIHAKPYDYTFEKKRLALVIIDMQRDFIEPGGFGAALGNDVSLLAPIIPAVVELLHAFRKLGLIVVHTKECHQPDLSDCPPAKLQRGRGKLRIGDSGPMGRILIQGEPGNDFIPMLKPAPGELVIANPGKGAF